ncbi:unnamed protein product [Prorocentrum cordatum]|uniref:Uncharacterized protein n=1 Tax=Prorocentrum cordatum TaxID=2364126 RepID=A0ABN9SWU7_9DINO|nr:unnamed protein product [Polarella glacialis]
MLVLSDSREIANLTSTVYRTFEMEDVEAGIGEALRAAGKAYNAESLELAEKKKKNEVVDSQARGPPHVRAFGAMIEWGYKNTAGEMKNAHKDAWDNLILGTRPRSWRTSCCFFVGWATRRRRARKKWAGSSWRWTSPTRKLRLCGSCSSRPSSRWERCAGWERRRGAPWRGTPAGFSRSF